MTMMEAMPESHVELGPIGDNCNDYELTEEKGLETSERQNFSSDDTNPLILSTQVMQPKFKSESAQLVKHNTVLDTSRKLIMAHSSLMRAKTDINIFRKDSDNAKSKSFSVVLKRRRNSCYSPKLKAQILKFAVINTKVATRKHFGIPESTLRDWITKAKKHGEKAIDNPDVVNDQSLRKGAVLSIQEDISMIVDVPSISMILGESEEESDYKDPNSEPKELVVSDTTTLVSKVSRYPHSFKENVVKFGELQGWKAAASKFGVGVSTVGFCAKKLGKCLTQVKRVDAGTREEVVNYGLQHNSWTKAAVQFGLSPNTVACWGYRAGYRLQIRRQVVAQLGRLSLEPKSCDTKSKKNNSVNPMQSSSPPVAAYSPAETPYQDNCEACGADLASDETLMEHVVSNHLTIEGLCDICGEDSEDFVDHFKIHLVSCQNKMKIPRVMVKQEFLDKPDDNQNYVGNKEASFNTEASEENEVLAYGQWILNPYYSSSSH